MRHVRQDGRGGMHVDADQHELTSWKHDVAPNDPVDHDTQLTVVVAEILMTSNAVSSSFGQ